MYILQIVTSLETPTSRATKTGAEKNNIFSNFDQCRIHVNIQYSSHHCIQRRQTLSISSQTTTIHTSTTLRFIQKQSSAKKRGEQYQINRIHTTANRPNCSVFIYSTTHITVIKTSSNSINIIANNNNSHNDNTTIHTKTIECKKTWKTIMSGSNTSNSKSTELQHNWLKNKLMMEQLGMQTNNEDNNSNTTKRPTQVVDVAKQPAQRSNWTKQATQAVNFCLLPTLNEY